MDEQPIIWIIDSEHWPRALIRAELIERGYDAIGFENIPDAGSALMHDKRPQLAILEFHNQSIGETELKQFFRKGIPMIALIGSTEDEAARIGDFNWAAVLRRPLSIGEICDAVQNLVE